MIMSLLFCMPAIKESVCMLIILTRANELNIYYIVHSMMSLTNAGGLETISEK